MLKLQPVLNCCYMSSRFTPPKLNGRPFQVDAPLAWEFKVGKSSLKHKKRLILSNCIPGVWQFIYGAGGGAVKEWNSLFKSNGLRSKLLAVTLCKQVSGLQRSPKPAPATPAPFLPPPSFCLPSAYTPLPSRCRESEQEKDREPVPGAGRSGAVGISLRGAGGTAQRPRPLWLISSAFGSG